LKLSVRHLTTYDYDGDVVDNLNAVRLKPAVGPEQRCEDFAVRLAPGARVHRHADYFGTEVLEFGVHQPHRRLEIEAEARVQTSPPPPPPQGDWSATTAAAYREQGAEYLLRTDRTPPHRALDELAAGAEDSSPLAFVQSLITAIPDRFEYRRGVTYVGSTVAELLEGGAGVCQDFVHLALVVLRGRGLPARYVSGYLFAADDGGEASVEVDTHAWLEVLLPRAGGPPAWVGADPTNRHLTAERHVKIGHGRHYADVPPVKGIYRGEADARLTVRVTITRED